MIASRAEIAAAIAGVLRLWRGDVSAFAAFDRSLPGFWRSYTAGLLGAPIQAVLLLLGRNESGQLSGAHDAALEAVAYVIVWIAYPLLIAQVVRRLDREDRFFEYMVPYNWAALAQLAVFVAAGLVRLAVPEFAGSVVMLVAIAAVLHLQWFIAREGLGIPGRIAFLIVLSDLSLSFLVGGVADYFKA